jgi:hypothetical protein
MANTFVLLATATGSTSASTLTFSAIPQTYTDLRILYSSKDTASGQYWNTPTMAFNGTNASTNSAGLRMFGIVAAGTGVSGDAGNAIAGTSNGGFGSNYGITNVYIKNYSSSLSKKMWTSESTTTNNTTGTNTNLIMETGNIWSSTAAITSITFSFNSVNFAASSNFYLYGIKNS